MIVDGQTMVLLSSRLALALLIISVALVFIRLVRGPQAVDRVVSLDLIAIMIVAFIGAYAVHAKDTSFLDVAIADHQVLRYHHAPVPPPEVISRTTFLFFREVRDIP